MAKPIKLENLTVHSWINRACKVSPFVAPSFLDQTMPFLMASDLIGVTGATLGKYRAKLIYATPAIHALIPLLVTFEAERSLTKALQRTAKAELTGNWLVVVWDGESTYTSSKGRVILEESFPTCKDAEGWADRRLVDSAPATGFAIITAKAEATILRPTRSEAIERVYPRAKGPFCKKIGGGHNKLSMGRKAARNSKAIFSHG